MNLLQLLCFNAIMRPKGADETANNVDPDLTAPAGAVGSGSALFAQKHLFHYFEFLRSGRYC